MIFRSNHETNYTIISNDLANDSSISFEARGVLMYLLSKPKDWIVRTTDLINASEAGKAKVNRIVNELIEAGYMVRKQQRNVDGSFGVLEIHVYGSPQTDYRETANPLPANPLPANQPLQSNERKQSNKRLQSNERKQKEVLVVIPESLDTLEFKQSWDNWNQHRKEIKKRQTPRSMETQLKVLATIGVDRAIAAITHSIANGYTGIYEPKQSMNGSSPTGQAESTKERLARIRAQGVIR